MQAKHIKGTISLCAALIAGVALFAASGAGAAKPRAVTKIDVSTKAAVVHYLRSIHVNPQGVVIQRGLRNYAGAHCPGKGWTCAGTRHTVVQIAKRGGLNRFACGTAKCAVVQFAGASRGLKATGLASKPKPPPPPNYALCVKTTGITQSCVINQPNATVDNKAVVWMVTPKLTGLTQSANYTASITQGPASAAGSSNNNLACVKQFVWIDSSTTKTNATSTTVTNDNHESISIQQNSLSGSNTVEGALDPAHSSNGSYDCDTSNGSQLQQDEQLTSIVTSKGSITQKQDTATTGSANVVVDIEQNQDINGFSGFFGNAIGENNATFEQSTNQVAIANTPNGTVKQTQGADVPDVPYSGLVGTINQDSKARSTASATQTETQCEDAVNMTVPTPQPDTPPPCPVSGDTGVPGGITLTQTQWGPEGVFTPPTQSAGRVPFFHKGYGKSQQTGAAAGVVDSFTLTQTSTQKTDNGPGSSQHNLVQGDCSSAGGSCTADQTTTLNNGTTEDGWTAPSIDNIKITCDPDQNNGHCVATPPPAPTFVSGPSDPNPSASAAFNFTDPATGGVHFLCKVDGGTLQQNVVDPCTSGTAFFQGYGPHTFQVAAADSHGNVSAYVPTTAFSWTNVPPDPTITASSEPTNPDFFGTSDTFQFTDAESPLHFQCTLDNSTTACNSGSVTYTSTDLSPGLHTFSVRAFDTSNTYGSVHSATYTWTILSLSVDALGTDGSAAGWACQPGGPIGLTLGTDSANTFAEIDLLDAAGTDLSTLEPTFTTNNYAAGSPRYYITLDNGDSLWGYPPNAGLNGTDFAWAINNGNSYQPWSVVQLAETGRTVTGASVIADGAQDPSTTDKIGNLQFNGTTYNSGTCS
jgi:hypothetical protein